MAQYRVQFFPEKSEAGYALENVDIVEKSAYWFANTDNFASDGYITTDDTTWANIYRGNFWVRMKPEEGYRFTDVYKTDSRDLYNNGSLTIESDGSVKVAPWENGTSTIIKSYLHMEVAENSGYTVTTKFTNCNGVVNDNYAPNSTVDVTINAYDGYVFIETPIVTMGEEVLNFTVSEDRTSATISFTITANSTITADAVEEPNKFYIETLTNCTCDKENNSYITGYPFTFTITANEGYELNGTVTYKIGNLTRDYSHFENENTTCTITINDTGDVTLKNAEAIKKVTKLTTFVNLYKVNDDILTQLSQVRYRDYDSNKIDYGTFISNLISIPFEISDTMIAGSGDIELGFCDSGIPAPLLSSYILRVNVGSIHVPEIYNNVYDYIDTQCVLYLPFTQQITLDAAYVVNHTLNIEYVINLYEGNGTVNIVSDFTNEKIASTTATFASKIPFMQTDLNKVYGDIQQFINNEIYQAYIEVTRYIPYNSENMFGKPTVDYGILENYKGYVEVSDIMLNINATNSDIEELKQLLLTGIYIK